MTTRLDKKGSNVSNIVLLRKSALHKAIEEVSDIKPDRWIVVGVSQDNNRVKAIGPERFDIVEMLGMLEYAKMNIEAEDEPTTKQTG